MGCSKIKCHLKLGHESRVESRDGKFVCRMGTEPADGQPKTMGFVYLVVCCRIYGVMLFSDCFLGAEYSFVLLCLI